MQTFKKKNIKHFKVVSEDKCTECEVSENDVIDEEEIIDELVTSTGGSISGDDKNVNNSEIKTAPQNTTDQFNAMAIQPNRYLYGVTGSAYSAGARQGTMESVDKIAKDKILNLLEGEMDVNGSPDTDSSDTQSRDSDALFLGTQRKVTDLINSATTNNMKDHPEKLSIILNQLLDGLIPLLDNNGRQMLKDKINA
jgi:hypothetical protein